jgi:predicted nuclease with TOPRIM domain
VRYAIVQGVEASDEEMHVFAVDSGKEHAPDMFLRAPEFLPSAEDARALGGVRTSVVYAVAGSREEVERFLELVQETVREVFDNILDDTLDEDLAERREGELVDDAFMTDLVRRAVLSSPDEIGYPATIAPHSQDRSHMTLGIWMIRPKSRRQANQVGELADRERPQVGRLLSAWMALD